MRIIFEATEEDDLMPLPISINSSVDLSEWSAVVQNGSATAVHDSAPTLGGVAGDVTFDANNTDTAFVAIDYAIPTGSIITARIYQTLLEDLFQDNNKRFQVVTIPGFGGTRCIIEVRRNAGVSQIRFQVLGDVATLTSAYHAIDNTLEYLQLKLTKSSDGVTADGAGELFFNDVSQEVLGPLIYFTNFDFNSFRMGVVGAPDLNTVDSFTLGKVEIRDDGVLPGAFTPNISNTRDRFFLVF